MKTLMSMVIIFTCLFSGCATMSDSIGNPNAVGMFGMTPLYDAACYNDVNKAKALLSQGGNPNIASSFGVAPLDVAVWKGHTEIVRLLLEGGADVNYVHPQSGSTALIMCGAYGNAEIAQTLISSGANVYARDKKGKTVVDYAIEYKKDEVLAILHQAGISVPYTGNVKRDLIIAVLSQNKEKVLELIQGEFDPNLNTRSGKSIFSYVIDNNWPDVVGVFIKKGARVDEKDNTGWTLLMTAALNNMNEIIKAFEDAGIQKPYRGALKDDLLMAVLLSDYQKVENLLDQGADINGRYRHQSSLLHYATYKNDQQMVRMLLDRGADCNMINEFGWPAIAVAIDKGGPAFGKIFIEKGASVSFPAPNEYVVLYAGIRSGDISFVKDLLKLGLQPNIDAVLLAQGEIKGAERFKNSQIAELIFPDVIRRQMLRAQAAVESAQTPLDYHKAIEEYSIAKKIAPMLSEIHYNLGLVQDKAGFYNDAIVSLRKYLELSPGASDEQEVQDMIYKIEYKRDQSQQ